MRSKLLVIGTAVLGFSSRLPADARDPYPIVAIGSAEETLAQAESRRDAAAILDVLADDVTLFPPGEAPVSGKEDASRWLARRPSSSVSHERLKASAVEVCGEYAIESGTAVPEAPPGAGAVTAAGTRYVSIWRRGADDSWKLRQTMWTRFSSAGARSAEAAAPVPAPLPATAAPPAAVQPVPPIPPPPPSDYLPIPDPRSLSDGFVRTIADQLRGRVSKIRSLQGAGGGDAARAEIAKADRELQALIRDVGWIDVGRFGVRASCNAAFIVSVSGDPLLIRSTVPRMGDLQSNAEGEACYVAAYEAYRKLSP